MQDSEEKYQAILENIEEGYYEVDLAGNFTFFNESLCKILGYSKDEMTGMNYRQYMSDQAAKAVYKIFNKVYRTGNPAKIVDYEIIRKDKINRNHETSVSLIIGSKGKPIGFRGIVRDITERKETERKLRESEEKYRTILKNIEDGYYEVDLTGNFTFFNESLCKILGYEKDEMTGMNYRQYMSDQAAKAVYKIFNKVYRTGNPAKIVDYEIIRKDKINRNHETSVSLIIGSKGKPIGFRGIVRDITERKETERKLRESEEKYRTILKNIEDGYYEVDLAGTFTFLNDSLCKILGYEKDEIIGMNFSRYMDKRTAKNVYKTFNEVYQTKKSVKAFDWSINAKEGNRKFIEASISLMVDSENKPVGFRGICGDVTKQRVLEIAKAELEQRRADFISMTSHELRTPLTIIKGYEAFLEKNLTSLSQDEVEEYFKQINKNISRIERLISGVSDIGRIERGIFEIEPKKTSVSKFLNESLQPHIELLDSQFQYKRIPEDLPCYFNVDESRLIQVLDNLIENAIKHTDANQRKISVIPEILPDMVRIKVSDNGAGIKLENLQKIFQPFTSFSTDYSIKGTGIGLFVSKMIIKRHHGRITAHSDGEGRGSTFIIELPRLSIKEI
ncbi:MAG: PAS domain S-box protein [Candidatus Thorarchaeota archaeon]